MSEIELLFSRAIDPDNVRVDRTSPRYTIPRTWGVYEIEGADRGYSGKPFRKGNHPIRLKELERNIGSVKLVSLFAEEELTVKLASCLNES